MRVRPFLTVELVRLFFRLVKVVTLLRVGVTLGTIGNVVGVTLVGLLVIVTGALVDSLVYN